MEISAEPDPSGSKVMEICVSFVFLEMLARRAIETSLSCCFASNESRTNIQKTDLRLYSFLKTVSILIFHFFIAILYSTIYTELTISGSGRIEKFIVMKISAITYSPFSVQFQPHVQGSAQAVRAQPGQPRVNGSEPPEKPSQAQQETGSQTTGQAAGQALAGEEALTDQELRVLEKLKQTDREVRQHEMAHVAAGGRYITSGATFTYQRGPDGRNYAVGGEVSIDTAPIPGDPEATLQKMRQIKTAALAPANPSSQDMKVASQATTNASKALSDLMMLQAKEQAAARENTAFGNLKDAADSYQKVNTLPEDDTASFQIAV